MNAPTLPLAGDFPSAARADWLALVKKTLKGAGAETLAGRSPDGLAVEPLYTAGDAPATAAVATAPRNAPRPWDIRAVIAHPDPARANAEIAEELAGGASSVLVKIDPAGLDGVAIGDAPGLERLLEGVALDVSTIALDAGFLGPACAEWLAVAAKASPAAAPTFHLDPLSAFAAAGASPGPIESHVTAGAGLAARLAETYPKASLFRAGSRVIHEAGGTPAEELAFAAAAALAYAKALARAGLTLEAAFARLTLGFAVDGDALASIAKLRAARVVWSKITGACGVASPARIEARSSRRMLTRADPWTNLVRLTGAGFAAGVGGADAVVLDAFTDPIGLPTAQARRLARNTSLILLEEAHLGRVADPFAGAWAVEALTETLARAAWSRFTAIEAAGGIVEALRGGLIAGQVEAARASLKAAIASGETRIVGVTDFAGGASSAAAVEPAARIAAQAPDPRLPGPDSHCPALPAVRLEALAS